MLIVQATKNVSGQRQRELLSGTEPWHYA